MVSVNYRLLVQKVDRSKEILKDELGRTLVPYKWVEVQSISLGSLKFPNHDILGFKLIPIMGATR